MKMLGQVCSSDEKGDEAESLHVRMKTTPLIAFLICSASFLGVQGAFAEETAPEGFEIATLAEGLSEPIAIAQTPDGRFFIAERGGAVRIIENGVVQESVFATVEVYTSGEGGLLGLAIDPDFQSTGYVYLFATVSPDEQQIIRLTDDDGLGANPTVIRANLPTTGTVHNGGGIRIGPDEKLYFSIGDNGRSENSQQLTSLAGKLCRINLDGTVPSDNPLTTPTGATSAIYAMGFRNPFRFCFSPTGSLYVGDVGSSGDQRREEINLVEPAQNFGWPEVEGQFDENEFPQYVNPIVVYHDEGSAISGCSYYAGEQFPSEYRNNLFHIDFTSQTIYRVIFDADVAMEHTLFAQLDGGPVDLMTALDGSLIYTELFTGRVQRISFKFSSGNDEMSIDDQPVDSGTGDGQSTDSVPRPALCGAGLFGAIIAISPLFLGLRANRTPKRVRCRRKA